MTPVRSEQQLLLIHGWGFGAAVWAPLVEMVGADVKVVTPSLPGYDGRSVAPAADMENVIAVLSQGLTSPAVVVGWSLGGLLALELAQRHPGRVRALGLVACLPCFMYGPGWPAGWTAASLAAVSARLQQDAVAARRYVAALSARGDVDSAHVKRSLLAGEAPAAAALRRDLNYLAGADLRDAFATLDIPVCAWFGANDALLDGNPGRVLRRLRPAAETKILPQRGHALVMSAAGKIAEDLELLL